MTNTKEGESYPLFRQSDGYHLLGLKKGPIDRLLASGNHNNSRRVLRIVIEAQNPDPKQEEGEIEEESVLYTIMLVHTQLE